MDRDSYEFDGMPVDDEEGDFSDENYNESLRTSRKGKQDDAAMDVEATPYHLMTSKEKRKERNKLLARKSRMRLKEDLENMKAKLMHLIKENESLKSQILTLPSPAVDAKTLALRDVSLPKNIMHLVQQLTSRTAKGMASNENLKDVSFCLSNALSKDMPIVYASPGFAEVTGYEMHEILGRNCRFLQGPKTDRNEIAKLKRSIAEGRDSSVVLLNYRKDGLSFWNHVILAHIKDCTGKTFFVVGIQTKVKPLVLPTTQPHFLEPYTEANETSSSHIAVSNDPNPSYFSSHDLKSNSLDSSDTSKSTSSSNISAVNCEVAVDSSMVHMLTSLCPQEASTQPS